MFDKSIDSNEEHFKKDSPFKYVTFLNSGNSLNEVMLVLFLNNVLLKLVVTFSAFS